MRSRPQRGGSKSIRLRSVFGLAEIILLSWFANCIVPAKLGDAYRAYLLKSTAGVSFSKTFGTILAERIIDMLLLFTLLAASVLVAFSGALPAAVLSIMQAGLVLVVLVLVGLMAMRNLGGLISRFVPKRFRRQYALFEQGTLGSFQAMPLVLTYSVLGLGDRGRPPLPGVLVAWPDGPVAGHHPFRRARVGPAHDACRSPRPASVSSSRRSSGSSCWPRTGDWRRA